jgi:hypothetical protein
LQKYAEAAERCVLFAFVRKCVHRALSSPLTAAVFLCQSGRSTALDGVATVGEGVLTIAVTKTLQNDSRGRLGPTGTYSSRWATQSLRLLGSHGPF